MEFNRLLSEQVDLMRRTGLNGVSPFLPSNGSHVSPSKTASFYKCFMVLCSWNYEDEITLTRRGCTLLSFIESSRIFLSTFCGHELR